MKKYFFLSLLILGSACGSTFKEDLLAEGIPLNMAEYRKEQVSNVVYTLSFDIPSEIKDPIPSKLKLDLEIHKLSHPLYLDFNADASLLKHIKVNGEEQVVNHQKEHIILTENLKKGPNSIEIIFDAGELSLNRNEDFLYTLLVPDRASTLFPCFDQPNIKARYILDVTVPQDWKVVCGAPLETTAKVGDKVHYTFGKSDPMSTYLFSMVAGKFESVTENPGVFDMTFLYRETDTTKIAYSLPKIFDYHQRSIDFLKDYTRYEFPFQKLDFAAIPGFQYGGMEHVGAIQYRQSSIFLDESATERRRMGSAKLIAHETSHMWFGDLVTMDWFNDVWMKEVFANFMADKIVNPTFPEINHRLQFMISHYNGAYGEDRTRGTNPIRQDLENLKNAGSLYGGIIYNKAPIMMRQLEATIGEKGFRDGIREYISTYAYGNATWNDLVNILDERTPKDLKEWSEVWVNQSGRPILSEQIDYEGERITNFTISQRAEDGSDKLWPQSFEITLVYPDSTRTIPVSISESSVNVDLAVGLSRPEAIIYNSNAFGYGVFPLKASDLSIIPTLKDEVARGYAYLNTYENALSGNIPPLEAFDLYVEGVIHEPNELVHGMICGQANSIFWKFLNKEQRTEKQVLVEQMLWNELLDGSYGPNIKKNIFGLWKSLAYSDKGKENLYRIWNKSIQIPDLKLNQDDYTDMAMTLALYGHDRTDKILEEAKAQLKNPDKIKRFEFLLPALSSDISVRDAFFESFKEAKNREKESWVLTACGYLHHPLRQNTAIKHVPLALELLEEIQKTGDIFFPKRWLSSTIGQYQSKEALALVDGYIQNHIDLEPSLKGKLLQATDNLYRFVNMNEQ
ncbi:MAG: peptidase M1 [Muricauda sp.]|nr:MULTISPECIES: M1 family aminopeptidase [unclassified Allomuricauda]MAU15684.1 peptidase M1 [Allomuricauda sp.]|tara:strand:- start:10401 stop:12956 length:2556 start_codon:yes stop_codon:yes gene_type:complete